MGMRILKLLNTKPIVSAHTSENSLFEAVEYLFLLEYIGRGTSVIGISAENVRFNIFITGYHQAYHHS